MRTFLAIFLFLIACTASAQIQKGTWMIGGDISTGLNFSEQETDFDFLLNVGTPPTAYFLSDRFALGGNLFFASIANEGFGTAYGIGPLLRYYFKPGANQLKWFSELNTLLLAGSNVNTTFQIAISGGFNYFLNSSVALETKLGINMLYNDEPSFIIPLQAGLQFFLSPENRSKMKSVEPAIGKGTLMIGGSAAALSTDGDFFAISLAPNIGYFVTDRFLLGASLPFDLTTSESATLTAIGIFPLLRYYFSDSGRTRWFANGRAGILYNSINFGEFNETVSESTFSFYVDAGMNYFLTPHVALEGMAGLRYSDGLDVWRIGADIGLQFFIGKNKEE